MNYRFKEDVAVVTFPKGNEEEDRGFKGCCCAIDALADVADAESRKNDKWGVFVKKSAPADIVTFTITKCGTAGNLTQLGVVGVFPNDPLLEGFVYDWRQYLNTYGPGKYTTFKTYTIAGVTASVLDAEFDLKPFSLSTSQYTVRMYSKFNSYMEELDADFTDSNFESMIRFDGKFGDRKPKTVINQLMDKGKVSVKTTRRNPNQYTLKSDGVGNCIVRPVLDLFVLNQDFCFMSDYNKGNLRYDLDDVPVVVFEVPDPEPIQHSRLEELTIIFSDRKENNNSLYNKG